MGLESSYPVLRRAAQPNRGAQHLVVRLHHKGLLYRPERGRLAFTLPLHCDYLRRTPVGV